MWPLAIIFSCYALYIKNITKKSGYLKINHIKKQVHFYVVLNFLPPENQDFEIYKYMIKITK